MKFSLLFFVVLGAGLFTGCKKHDHPRTNKLPADVAHAWMQLHIQLTKTTPGYNSIVSLRSFGYAGVTLYESLVPATRNRKSLLTQLGGNAFAANREPGQYYWPASANAAMAELTRKFFESTSAANKVTIDSLEAAFNQKFQYASSAKKIANGIEYGRKVATSIFAWSATDGGHEAYKHVTDPTYIPPVGDGLWIPTPPPFGPPVHPRWGSNRSFIPNVANITKPAPPMAYSESNKSPFYQMVDQLYKISLTLTHEDSVIAKFWGDIPGNINVPAHSTNIVTQLVKKSKMDLFEAAAVYALHGISQNDAGIAVCKAKYTYNLLRPVSYIRKVFAKPGWNTVIPTPSHPEYPAAHAVVSAASATVLEAIFGNQYAFSDHTYDAVYGIRHFNSFEAYAKESGRSRLLAGIHYEPSINVGFVQGKKVGNMVNKLRSQLGIQFNP